MPDPVWIGSIAVRAGAFHVGLRSDETLMLEELRTAFIDHLVTDEQAPYDFGISVAGRSGDGPRLLPYLAHGRLPILRSRARSRLIRRLDLELGQLVTQTTDDLLALHGFAALVKDRKAALVPAGLAERSTAVERLLTDSGVGVAESIGLRLDPSVQELVVPSGLIDGDPTASSVDELAVPSGRYPVAGIYWSSDALDEHERPSVALVRLLGHLGGFGERNPGEALRGLAKLTKACSTYPIGATGTSDLRVVLNSY